MNRRSEGAWAERVVERRLRRDGWEILARNTHIAGVEVDILARRRGKLVVWEVKRLRDRQEFPALRPEQLRRLMRAAERCAYDSGAAVSIGLATVRGGRPFTRVELQPLAGDLLGEE